MRRKNNEISWAKLVQLSPTIEYYTTHYSAIIAAYICFSAIFAKIRKIILFGLMICMLISACACQSKNISEIDYCAAEDYLPLYFNDEDQFIEAIASVKKSNTVTYSSTAEILIESNVAGVQKYDALNDKFDLESVEEYYKPANMLAGLSLCEIAVKREYISFAYASERKDERAIFTWLCEMSPEVAMNGLFGRGAISEREIEHKGVKYVILQWPDHEPNKSGGYSIHWTIDGKAYQASIPFGYTDEEMLDFCQREVVSVK